MLISTAGDAYAGGDRPFDQAAWTLWVVMFQLSEKINWVLWLVAGPSRANHLEQQCALQGRRMGVCVPDERKNTSSGTPHH